MAVEDILPTILVIAVIYFLVRWLTKGNTPVRADGSISGVTPSMVETVHSAFPDIPLSNIVYHLAKTRSAQATSEEILERGFLPAAPATYTVPPSLIPPNVNPPSAPPSPARPSTSSSSTSSSAAAKVQASLIERYGLSGRISSRKGKGKEMSGGLADGDAGSGGAGDATSDGDGKEDQMKAGSATSSTGAGAKGKWEDTREARERGLKERKERMILEARRRLMEKQAKEEAASYVA